MPFEVRAMSSSSSALIIPTAIALTITTLSVSFAILSQFRKFATEEDSKDEENEKQLQSSTTSVSISLPAWTESQDYFSRKFTSDEEMMAVAVDLSQKNVTENTGGPFGTAIYERCEGGECRLISIGVNRVVPLNNSTLHGETVAIQMAQKKLNSYTLNMDDSNDPKRKRSFELFTSCEPCAMCLGAVLWSGVSRMVCAAKKSDASAIGFDEGPVFDESYKYLVKAGVDVKKDVLGEEAACVLRDYGRTGVIYNGQD